MFGSILGQRQSAGLSQNESHSGRRTSEPASQNSIRKSNGGTDVRRRSSTTSTHSSPLKRYAMYDFNWHGVNHEEGSQNDSPGNSALAAKQQPSAQNLPLTQTPPPQTIIPTTPTVDSAKTSMSIDTTKTISEDSENGPPISPHGGITVTKVKVVEYHSATEDESSAITSSVQTNNNNESMPDFGISSRLVKTSTVTAKHRHSHSDSDLNIASSQRKSIALQIHKPSGVQRQPSSKVNVDKERKAKKGGDGTKKSKPKKRSGKGKNSVRPDVPGKGWEDLEERHHPGTHVQSLKRSGATVYRRKRGPPRHVELAPTSNPAHSNDPTDLEDDVAPLYTRRHPWVPKPLHPPQLKHTTLVPLPHFTNLPVAQQVSLSRASSVSRRASRIMTTHSNRSSLITSCNPHGITRIIGGNQRRLSRVASQRKRTSIIVTGGKRSSLLLRRQLLEESIMMSLLGIPQSQHNPSSMMLGQPGTKTVIRRKTKKGSNAKLEDREARRERKRREKKEKRRLEKLAAASDNEEKNKTENVSELARIIETQDLSKKIGEESKNREENFVVPLPPPRRSPAETSNTVTEYFPPTKRQQNNTSSLLLTLGNRGEQRSTKPESLEPPSEEPPPFPTHLSRPPFPNNNIAALRLQSKPPVSARSTLPPPAKFDTNISDDDGAGVGKATFSMVNPYSEVHDPNPLSMPPPLAPEAGKRQKSGLSILGLFNKPNRDAPKSSIGSPQFPLSPTSPATPRAPSIHNGLLSSSLSPPLSPRSLMTPQLNKRSNRSKRTTESLPLSPTLAFISEAEKIRKMQNFEAIVSEIEAEAKKRKTRKKRAHTTAIITTTTTTTTTTTAAGGMEAPERDGIRRRSDETDIGSSRTGQKAQDTNKNDEPSRINGRTSEDRGSVTMSIAESTLSIPESLTIHYRPEEHEELGKAKRGKDGVIRLTLTPAVCR